MTAYKFERAFSHSLQCHMMAKKHMDTGCTTDWYRIHILQLKKLPTNCLIYTEAHRYHVPTCPGSPQVAELIPQLAEINPQVAELNLQHADSFPQVAESKYMQVASLYTQLASLFMMW